MKKKNNHKFKTPSTRTKWMIQGTITILLSIIGSEVTRFFLSHQGKKSALMSSIASDSVALVIGAVGFVLIFKGIYKPLKAVEKAMSQTSSGFLQTTLPMESKDEWGRIASSLHYSNSRFRDFVMTVRAYAKKQEEVSKGLANLSSQSQEYLQTATQLTNSTQSHIQAQSKQVVFGQQQVKHWKEQVHELKESCRRMELFISSSNKEMSHARMELKEVDAFIIELQALIDQLQAGVELFEESSSQTQGETEVLRSYIEEIIMLTMNGFMEVAKGNGQQENLQQILEQIQKNANDCRHATFGMEEQVKKMGIIQDQLKHVAFKTQSALNEQTPVIDKAYESLSEVEDWLKKGLIGLEQEATLLQIAEDDSKKMNEIIAQLLSTEKPLHTCSSLVLESLEKQATLNTQPEQMVDVLKESHETLHKEARRYMI